MAESLGVAILDLIVDDSKLVAGLSTAQAKTHSKLTKMATASGVVGQKLTRGVTLPVVAAGAAAVVMATKFESSMSDIEGLVGVSSEQVEAWKSDLLELGPKVGKSPLELADALFFVTSAGFEGEAAIDALTISAKASAAGLGKTEVVADAVTSAINAYGAENMSAAEAGDILAATVREGKAEASSLAPVLGGILPLASELGVGFNEIGAAMAQQTRIGVDAATSATNIQAVFTSLLKPTKQQADAFEDMGTSADEVRQMLGKRGLGETLAFLQKKTGGSSKELAKLFPNVRALRGLLALASNGGKDFNGILAEMTDNTGALDKAFASAEETTQHKFNKALAQLQATAIELGGIILPIAADIAAGFAKVAKVFADLPSPVQRFLVLMMLVAAAAGPILLVVKQILLMRAAWIALDLAFKFSTVGLVITAIVLLALALIVAYKESKTFRKIVQAVFKAIGAASEWVVEAAKKIVEAFKSALNWVRGNWRLITAILLAPFFPVVALATDMFGIRSRTIAAVRAVIGFFRSNWKTIATIILAVFMPLSILATDAFGIRSRLIAAFNRIVGAVRGAMSNVLTAVTGNMNRAVGSVTTVGHRFLGAARTAGQNVVQGIVNGLAALLGRTRAAIWSGVSGAIGAAAGLARTAAGSIGRALVNGIISAVNPGALASAVTSKLTSGLNSAVNSVKGKFKILSPSRVMAEEIGEPLAEGVAVGIENLTPDIDDAMLGFSVPSVSPTSLAPASAGAGAAGGAQHFHFGNVIGTDPRSLARELNRLISTERDRRTTINNQ